MELLFRLIVFVAAISGSSAPTQRHFAQLRVSCIAIDVFLPLLASGQALDLAADMADSTSNQAPSAPTASPAVHGHQASTHKIDGAHEIEHKNDFAPMSSISAGQVHPDPAKHVATVSDILLNSTHMTVQERKNAEETLRKKYGAIDEAQSVSSDVALHGKQMTMKERKEAEEILKQKYGNADKQ